MTVEASEGQPKRVALGMSNTNTDTNTNRGALSKNRFGFKVDLPPPPPTLSSTEPPSPATIATASPLPETVVQANVPAPPVEAIKRPMKRKPPAGSTGIKSTGIRRTHSNTSTVMIKHSDEGAPCAEDASVSSSRVGTRSTRGLVKPVAMHIRAKTTIGAVQAAVAAGTLPATPRAKRRDNSLGSSVRKPRRGSRDASLDLRIGADLGGGRPLPSRRSSSRIEELVEQYFTFEPSEIEQLMAERSRLTKYDKAKREKLQDTLIGKMKGALDRVAQERESFVAAVTDVEARLEEELAATEQRCDTIETEHIITLDGMAALRKSAEEAEGLLAVTMTARDNALAERDANTSSAATEARRLEAVVNEMKAQLSEGAVAAAKREEGLKKELETVTKTLKSECAALKIENETLKRHQAAVDAELRITLETAAGTARSAERSGDEVRRLETALALESAALARAHDEAASARASLDARSSELSAALGGFAEGQRAADRREAELREAGSVLQAKLASSEAERSRLAQELAVSGVSAIATVSELAGVRDQLTELRAEAADLRASLAEAQRLTAAMNEGLAVERELRARAELREEEERRERTAATAQLMAIEVEKVTTIEQGKAQRLEAARESELALSKLAAERAALSSGLRASAERVAELEGEVRTLREAMETAQTSAQHLDELTKAQGELEAVRLRHSALVADSKREAEAAAATVAELEQRSREGEIQRRKMHNLIQELRGNVRVYARVRPFLPDDGVPPGSQPCIQVKGDGVGCIIQKRDSAGVAVKTDTFAYDKVFPPSAGQESVFQEVSEFVQSALDGYNVCLFSYGQTGSGKTHTMTGSGAGPMRGIIPRAMEQVGRYKTALEEQGWVYEMQVSFLEIYNEQIRDLLRDRAPGGQPGDYDAKHEIKRDHRGVTTVTDLTMRKVDPTNPLEMESVLETAARHRSVGSTAMNAVSSRSHSVFTLYLHATNTGTRSALNGTLHLVDLAGSERLERSGVSGERLKETVSINKTLSSLADVFSALASKASHVPFRNSKLTYLLQPALSGDGKTLMLVNLSPTDDSHAESICSLRFAAQVNQCELGRPKRHVSDLKDEGSVSSTASSRGPSPTAAVASRKHHSSFSR